MLPLTQTRGKQLLKAALMLLAYRPTLRIWRKQFQKKQAI